jgi:GntR family transcriptional repressor for pyruvate dehydrogenase complex
MMMTQIFPTHPRSTIPGSLAETIRAQIVDGRLAVGDRLPSIEALAEQFGVGRASVREALQVLATLGLVDIRHGRGAFIRDVGESPDRYATWIREQRYALAELCELRVAVETTAARLAAAKATADDLRTMEAALKEAGDPGAALPEIVAADTRFHWAIVGAARNRLLDQALDLTQQLLTEVRTRTLSLPGEVSRAKAAHQRIWQAIARGESEEAAAAMRAHLRAVEEDLGIDVP